MWVSGLRWRVAVALLCTMFLAGPVIADAAAGAQAASEVGFFQKMKNKINSWFDEDGKKTQKKSKKKVKKTTQPIKKEVKKSSGQSDGRKVISFIKKRAQKASNNIQKSIDKDKKTLSRKLK